MLMSKKDFFQFRIRNVKETASLYTEMVSSGAEPRYEDRSAQVRCSFGALHPGSGRDNKPSARYYPKGERNDYDTYYCWGCTPQPLDVIGWVQRTQGVSFPQALRRLEQQYRIKYDDIEFSADVEKEIRELGKKVKVVDPKRLFHACEEFLRINRLSIGPKRFVGSSYVLDKIYFSDDSEKPTITVNRLTKWLTAMRPFAKKEVLIGT